MRKAIILGIAIGLVVGITACKKSEYAALGKYAEVGPVMDKMIKATEVYIVALEKSMTADEVVAATDTITGKMTELRPKIKKINEKFPELNSLENPSAGFKAYADRIKGLMEKMEGLMMSKIAPFASDPKVKAAQERHNKVMGEMK